MAETQVPQHPPDPFNKEDADIDLPSSDGVNLRIHSVIMNMASGLFSDMSTLPPPPGTRRTCPPSPFDAATLVALLRLIYPIERPTFRDVMEVGAVLQAALFYDMELVVKDLKHKLSAFADPLRLYVIAQTLDLEDEAMQAAVEWCESAGFDLDKMFVPEMSAIPAGSYYRLLQFCTWRRTDVPISDAYRLCGSSTDAEEFSVPAPFNQPLAQFDIIVRSGDGHEFHVCMALLRLASTTFASLLDELEPNEPLVLKERGKLILLLLQLIYPTLPPIVTSPDVLADIWDAAKRYQLPGVREFAEKEIWCLIEQRPLEVYFAGVRLGWKEVARYAAKRASLLSVDNYTTIMETTPAFVYHGFLQYRQYCRRAVIKGRQELFDCYTPNIYGKELYDVYWSLEDTSSLWDYHLHCTWVLHGDAVTAITPGVFATAMVVDRWSTLATQALACTELRHRTWQEALDYLNYYEIVANRTAAILDEASELLMLNVFGELMDERVEQEM